MTSLKYILPMFVTYQSLAHCFQRLYYITRFCTFVMKGRSLGYDEIGYVEYEYELENYLSRQIAEKIGI